MIVLDIKISERYIDYPTSDFDTATRIDLSDIKQYTQQRFEQIVRDIVTAWRE